MKRKTKKLELPRETVRALTVVELFDANGGAQSGNAIICESRNCTGQTSDQQTGSLATCRANSNCGCGQDVR